MTDDRGVPHGSAREPNPWELLLRQQEQTQATLEAIRKDMLTSATFKQYQDGTDRRFEAGERRQAEWEAKSEKAHGELGGRIDAVEDMLREKVDSVRSEMSAREEKARSSRGQVWLALGLLVAGIIAPRVWEVLSVTGAQP